MMDLENWRRLALRYEAALHKIENEPRGNRSFNGGMAKRCVAIAKEALSVMDDQG